MKYWRESILFVGAVLLFSLFNWNLPITDPVEANYALTAKEMLSGGDWLSPRIYGEYWFDKPVLTYWAILVSYQLFGVTEFAARLPMAVAGAGGALYLYWFVRRVEGDALLAVISVAVLVTSLEYWVVSKVVITDAFLFLFHNASIGYMYLAMREGKRKYAFAAYIAAGLAVLTKGPVGVLLPGLTIFIFIFVREKWNFRRGLAKLHLKWGICLLLLTAAPWYVYMYAVHDKAFIEGFIGLHNITRATVSEHPSSNVFYYYLIVVPLSLLPWTGVFLRSVIGCIKKNMPENTALLLCWLSVPIVFYTFMATKYPTYAFVVLFPAAILIAKKIRYSLWEGRRRNWLWVTVPTFLLAVVLWQAMNQLKLPGAEIMQTYLLVLVLVNVFLQLKVEGWRIFTGVVTGQIVLIVFLTGIVLPGYAQMRTAKHLAAYIPQGAVAVCLGDYQTSAVFYYGTNIPRLVGFLAEPVNSVWAKKAQYPHMAMDDFEREASGRKDVYIIVHEYSNERFLLMPLAKSYRPVAFSYRGILYKRDP